MSSTAVVSLSTTFPDIHRQLGQLRERVEELRGNAVSTADSAVYRAISRDLFDLSSRVQGYGWEGSAPHVRTPFAPLRVNELKQADQQVLLAFLANEIHAYAERHGEPVSTSWATQAIARALHTTQDEVYYGLTYAEAEGLVVSEGGKLKLL